MYAHSNELEETGVVHLVGVNVESDPHKESLLGVSAVAITAEFSGVSFFLCIVRLAKHRHATETVFVYFVHSLELACPCGS